MHRKIYEMENEMLNILLAGERTRFTGFAEVLEGSGAVTLYHEAGGAGVLARLSGATFQIVVIDEQLLDMDGMSLAKEIARLHPFVNTALTGSRSAEDFHEATEGLGVLMQLPSPPDGEAADRLLTYYRSIWG